MGPEAHVDDIDVVVERPLEGKDQGRDVAFAVRIEDLEGVEVDGRGDADDEITVLLGG